MGTPPLRRARDGGDTVATDHPTVSAREHYSELHGISGPGRKTISQIRAEARSGVLVARVHAQIEEIVRKDASNGKPFWEIRLRDAADCMVLKAWSDSPSFATCEGLERGMPIAIEGEFSVGAFGLDAKAWSVLALPEDDARNYLRVGRWSERPLKLTSS